MSIAFWSVEVGKDKEKTVQPPEGFVLNVTQLALGDAYKGKYVVKVKTVSVEGDDIVAVIATLKPGNEQVSVNLVFGFDVPVTFIVDAENAGTVHLSGYYQPGPDMSDDDDDYMGMGDDEEDSEEEEEESEDDDDMDQEEKIKGAEAAIAKLGAAKKDKLVVTGKSALPPKKTGKNEQKMVVESDDSEDEDSSEEDSEDDEVDEAFVKKMIERNNLNVSANASDSESEDDDSEDDGSDEQPPMKVSKGTPKGIVTASGSKHQHSTPKGAKSAPPNTPATATGKKGNKPKTPINNPGSNKKGNQHPKSGDKRKR